MIRIRSPIVALAAVLLGSAGCLRGCPSDKPPIHPNPNMDSQERYEAQESSEFFYDGKTMREPIPGTIARGELVEDVAFATGKGPSGDPIAENPLGDDATVLSRGEDRFEIYCTPCHDRRGEGKGILAERGGVPTPSFHIDRVRELSDGEMFDVVTNGKGLMPGYRYPVPARDRWAIIAHLRSLQERYAALESSR